MVCTCVRNCVRTVKMWNMSHTNFPLPCSLWTHARVKSEMTPRWQNLGRIKASRNIPMHDNASQKQPMHSWEPGGKTSTTPREPVQRLCFSETNPRLPGYKVSKKKTHYAFEPEDNSRVTHMCLCAWSILNVKRCLCGKLLTVVFCCCLEHTSAHSDHNIHWLQMLWYFWTVQ